MLNLCQQLHGRCIVETHLLTENYSSFGIAADIGIVRRSSDHLTTIALCFKQLGRQLRAYYGGAEHENWSDRSNWDIRTNYSTPR